MGGDHGRVYFVVYSFYSLLAGGAAGGSSLSVCLADYAAISNRRNCRARSFGTAIRDVFASGKIIAWAPADLKLRQEKIFD